MLGNIRYVTRHSNAGGYRVTKHKESNFMLELSNYPDTGQTRVYDIEAISIPIVYNRFGDHDPNGLMYVLKQDSERIQKKSQRAV